MPGVLQTILHVFLFLVGSHFHPSRYRVAFATGQSMNTSYQLLCFFLLVVLLNLGVMTTALANRCEKDANISAVDL
jgi:hypothetical protein